MEPRDGSFIPQRGFTVSPEGGVLQPEEQEKERQGLFIPQRGFTVGGDGGSQGAPPPSAAPYEAPEEGSSLLDRVFGVGSPGGVWSRGFANLANYAGLTAQNIERFAAALQDEEGPVYDAGQVARRVLSMMGAPAQIPFGDEAIEAIEKSSGFVGSYLSGLAQDIMQGADPATGVLEREAENWMERLDPRRMYQVVGEGLPTTLGQGLIYLGSPAAAMLTMGASSMEGFLQDVDRYEQETGREVPMSVRIGGAAAIGTLEPILERYGIKAIGRGIRATGIRAKVVETLLRSAPGEGLTEALQGVLNQAAEQAYKDQPVSAFFSREVAQDIQNQFWAGFLIGGTLSGAGSVLGSMAGTPDAEVQFLQGEEVANGPLEARFRVNKVGHELYGEVVSLDQLQEAGLTPPAFRRELLKQQLLSGEENNLTEPQVELWARFFLDRRAAKLGLSTEDYIAQTGLVADNRAGAVKEGSLFQLSPIWNSKLYDELEVGGRLPKAAKPGDIKSLISGLQEKGKFKAEEVEWTGVMEWLDLMEEQGVEISREQVLEFIQNNGVQVETRILQSPESHSARQVQMNGHALMTWLIENADRQAVAEAGYTDMQSLTAEVMQGAPAAMELVRSFNPPNEILIPAIDAWNVDQRDVTRYDDNNYRMPGGKHYREILLMLPERGMSRDEIQRSFREAQERFDRASENYVHGDPTSEREYTEAMEAQARFSRLDQEGFDRQQNYYGPHWQQPNVLSHARVTDREGPNGERILFVEEIQSDWHQTGRDVGYRNEATENARRSELREELNRYGDVVSSGIQELAELLGVDIQEAYDRISGNRNWQGLYWELTNSLFPQGSVEYRRGMELRAEIDRAQTAISQINAQIRDVGRGAVPDAPFKSTWPDLTVKRLLRLATDEGYDGIAFTQGELIQSYVGGDLEGQKTFYDQILPRVVKKHAKESLTTMRLEVMEGANAFFEVEYIAPGEYQVSVWNNADDQVPFHAEIRPTNEQAVQRGQQMVEEYSSQIANKDFNYLPLTDKVRNRVASGQPLFQGEKGAFQIMADGKRVISILKGGDFSTLVHEGAHLFRADLTAEELAALDDLMEIGPEGWTEEKEESFARQMERWVASGKPGDRKYAGIFRKFQEWMLDIYIGIKGSAIDVELSPEMRQYFDGLFEDAITEARSDTSAARSLFNRFADFFFIEREWRDAGMPELGFALKNFYSQQEYEQFRSLDVWKEMFLSVKSEDRVLEAILTYESREATAALVESNSDPELARAVEIYGTYVQESLAEYRALGGLEKGFVEAMTDRVQDKLVALIPKNADKALVDKLLDGTITSQEFTQLGLKTKKLEAMSQLIAVLKKLEDVRYSHIPLFFFEKYLESNPTGAASALRVLASQERKSISLRDLLESGVIAREDISSKDILSSYGARKGRDIGLLKIRKMAEQEGAARKILKGFEPDERWHRDVPPLFRGYELNGALHAWVTSFDSPRGPWWWVQSSINSSKTLAFYNPVILNSYNTIQLALATMDKPQGITSAVYQGLNDYFRRTPEFWTALEEGISSQPFALPWSEFRRHFDRIEEGGAIGASKRLLIGGLMGATAGSIVPGFGTVSGAVYGGFVGAMRPGKHLSISAQKAWKAIKGEENQEIARELYRMPLRMLKETYELSWDIAWGFDLMTRLILNRQYLNQGFTPREAAQQSAEVFGDYAAIRPTTRRGFNMVLFTPTYKLAMGRLFFHSIQGLGQVLNGTASAQTRRKAAIVANAFGIVLGIDMLATALGWERDEFGRRYHQDVIVEAIPGAEDEDQPLNVGTERELTLVFGGPHDLFYKFGLRARQAFTDPLVHDPISDFMRRNKWEVTPLLRVSYEAILQNRDMNGEPLRRDFEPFHIGAARTARFMTENIVQMTRVLTGEELSEEGARLFEQQYSSVEQIISGAFITQYSRDPKAVRVANQIERLYQDYRMSLRPKRSDMLKGMTRGELQEQVSWDQLDMKTREFKKRLDKLIKALEEEEYGNLKAEETQPRGPVFEGD